MLSTLFQGEIWSGGVKQERVGNAFLPQYHLGSLACTDHHLLLELVTLRHTELAHGSDLALVHV